MTSLVENYVFECSQESAISSNQTHTWLNDIGNFNGSVGDTIQVYQSMINVRGANNETISVIDETINGENPTKTPIEIQYYKSNDNLNSLPMPYSFQLLSLGTEEQQLDAMNYFTGNKVQVEEGVDIIRSDIRSNEGMKVGTNCNRNIQVGTITSLCNLLRPVDCSRYTLMELDRNTLNRTRPYVRHKIKTGTHTFELKDLYYSPPNLADNMTKSLNNPQYNNIEDEFGNKTGINITSPAMISEPALYRSRKNYGGTSANDTWSAWYNGNYLSKNTFGFDLFKRISSYNHYFFGSYTDYGYTNYGSVVGQSYGSFSVKNAFPQVSDFWFNPSPSWDFYGGTDRYFIGTNYHQDHELQKHTNYFFKFPNSLMKGEDLFNENIKLFDAETLPAKQGGIGEIITGFSYTDINIKKFTDFFNSCLEEGVYEDIKVRDYYDNTSGTKIISLNTDTQRAISIAPKNPHSEFIGTDSGGNNVYTESVFGSATMNQYYGFETNLFGYNFGCDIGGIGDKTTTIVGTGNNTIDKWNADILTDPADDYLGTLTHSINNSLGSCISDIQLIKYDPNDPELENGLFVKSFRNDDFYIGFKVGTSEGGFQSYGNSGTLNVGGEIKIGWFPKFTDIVNSAICSINPNGLGSEIDKQILGTSGSETIITDKIVGKNINSSTGSVSNNITNTAVPKSHSSSNPNSLIGAIFPKFQWDNDLSRFKITDLYTPEYISNSVYSTNTYNPTTQGGTPVFYINPVFQQSQNFFIGRYSNHTIPATLDPNNPDSSGGSRQTYALNTYFYNADRNRNIVIDKFSIMDSSMGIYISKVGLGSEDTFDDTIFGKMGFTHSSLFSNNNRNFRNENYALSNNPSISNPPTNNVNLDTSINNQLSRNNYNLPTFNISGAGEVLQREITGSSTEIISSNLPIKNFTPYYVIESDILDYTNGDVYQQSENRLPVIDICSLNYNSSDYYYAESSQLVHTASKDYNLSKIRTAVRRPSGLLASELSGKSSIIYKITRNKTIQNPEYENLNSTLSRFPTGKKLSVKAKGISSKLQKEYIQSIQPIISNGIVEIERDTDNIVANIENNIEEADIEENNDIVNWNERMNNVRNEFTQILLENEAERIAEQEEINARRDIENIERNRIRQQEIIRVNPPQILDEELIDEQNRFIQDVNEISLDNLIQEQVNLMESYQVPEEPSIQEISRRGRLRRRINRVNNELRNLIQSNRENEYSNIELDNVYSQFDTPQSNIQRINNDDIRQELIEDEDLDDIDDIDINAILGDIDYNNILETDTGFTIPEERTQEIEELLSTPLKEPEEKEIITPEQDRQRIQQTRELDKDIDEFMGRRQTEQPEEIELSQIRPTMSIETAETGGKTEISSNPTPRISIQEEEQLKKEEKDDE